MCWIFILFADDTNKTRIRKNKRIPYTLLVAEYSILIKQNWKMIINCQNFIKKKSMKRNISNILVLLGWEHQILNT